MSNTSSNSVDFNLEVIKGMIAKIILLGTGFIGAIIFAQELGPVGFGAYYLLISISNVFRSPFNGFGFACMKRLSESDAKEGEIVGFGLLTIGGFFIVVSVAAVLGEPILEAQTDISGVAIPFIVLSLSLLAFLVSQRLLSATGRVSLMTWIDLAQSLITLGLQLIFLLHVGLGVHGLIYGFAIGNFVVLPLTYYYLDIWPKIPSISSAKSIVSHAKHRSPYSVLNQLSNHLPLILLGVFAAPVFVGQYEAAFKLTVPALFITTLLETGIMARVSERDSEGSEETSDITGSLAIASAAAIPLLFGSLAISEEVLRTVFGQEYIAAVPVLIGLSAYRVLQTQSGPIKAAVEGCGHPDKLLKIRILTTSLTGIGGAIALYLFSPLVIIGVLVGTEILRYILLRVTLSTILPDVNYLPETLRREVEAGLIMTGALLLANRLVAVTSWLHLIGLLVLGGGVYAFWVWARSEEVRTMVKTAFQTLKTNSPVSEV